MAVILRTIDLHVPPNAGKEHAGFSPTRQAFLTPSSKRGEVFSEPYEGVGGEGGGRSWNLGGEGGEGGEDAGVQTGRSIRLADVSMLDTAD